MKSSYITNLDSLMHFTYRNVFCSKARVKRRRTPIIRGEKLYDWKAINYSKFAEGMIAIKAYQILHFRISDISFKKR